MLKSFKASTKQGYQSQPGIRRIRLGTFALRVMCPHIVPRGNSCPPVGLIAFPARRAKEGTMRSPKKAVVDDFLLIDALVALGVLAMPAESSR